MNTDKRRSQKRFLLWAIPIAVIVFVGIDVAIISFVWFRRTNTRLEASVPVAPPADASATNWSPGIFSIHAPNGALQTSENSWSIKGGRAFMQVRRKADDSLELRYVYPFNDVLAPETIALVRARWGLSQVEKLAAELNITPEQLAALKSVSPATDIPVSGLDRERLRELFDDYLLAGDKAETEKTLVEAVAALDAKYYGLTRERIDGIAQKVKSIFSEDQLAALSGRFGAQGR